MASSKKVEVACFLFLILASILFAGYGWDRSPFVWCDEVFYAEPGRQISKGNNFSSPIFFDLRDLESTFFLQPPLHFVVQSQVFNIFGVSQATVRLPPVILYVFGILLVFFIIKSTIGKQKSAYWFALLGALLFACDKSIIESARSGRSDSLAVFLMLLSMLIWNNNDLKSTARIFLTSVFGTLATLTHPVAFFLQIGFFIGLIFSPKTPDRNTVAEYLCFFSPLLILSIPYVIYVTANWQAWKSQFLPHVMSSTGGGVSLNLGLIWDNFYNEFKYRPSILLLSVLALFSQDKSSIDRIWFPTLGLSCVALFSNQSFYKFFLPFWYLSVLTLLASSKNFFFTSKRRQIALSIIIPITILNFLLFPISRTLIIYLQFEQRDPFRVNELIGKHIPANSRVLGIPEVYYACLNNNVTFRYASPLYGLRLSVTEEDQHVFEKAVEAYNPEFLILEGEDIPSKKYSFLRKFNFVRLFRYFQNLSNPLNSETKSIDISIWKVCH
jgi:4-amino-4-deoxy-L-arabinose transferase-like glycosyltransferase